MKKNQVLPLTQAALLLATLMAIQIVTQPLSQIVTGSLVNLVLLIAVFNIGISAGMIVAFLSPFIASIFGFVPALIHIVIFVAIANCLFVFLAWTLARGSIKDTRKVLRSEPSLIIAALVKTAVLWVGLVMLALPLIPGISEQQRTLLSASFTWPQLATSLIGGALALIVVPILYRAEKYQKG